ncbi:DUF2570 family protein [Vibrio rumoiensis]|uniref:DUF2570 family protein n=1 Tax=Vibrio rumoiensis TaxID=76258 RepID=A0ABW7IZW3_9VIBR
MMDLISSFFSGTIAKVMPIIFVLFFLSILANYYQSNRIDALLLENKLIKERLGDVIAENNALAALVEKREQERDMNQSLVDQLNQDNHKLQQQASQVQTQIRTVIKHEKCYDTAIPNVAIDRMREQYQSGDAVQNGGAKTASRTD